MKVFATALLVALSSVAGAAAPKLDPVDDALARIRSELAKAGCVEAGFTQTYVPAGFSTGRGERGKLVLGGASRIRFDYEKPAGRLFAVDGDRVTALDPASKTATRRTLSAGEKSRYPLFELAEGHRPAGFRLELRKEKDGEWLLATPLAPDDELASGRVLLGPKGGAVKQVEWTDGEGNRNRFDLDPLRPRKDCSAPVFAPAVPAGFRLSEEDR